MVLVTGFGNPLMDCLIKVSDRQLLIKHNLNDDDAKEIPEDEMNALIKDIEDSSYECHFNPGGCALNTLRILQWIMGVKNSTVMFGSIGEDRNGKLLKEMVETSKVCTRFAIEKSQPTGLIVSLVNLENRSLVGNIGAAASYNAHYLQEPDNQDILKSTDLIYVEGFFLTGNRYEVALRLLEFSKRHKKKLVFNLCARYLIEKLTDLVVHFVRNSTIVVGNRKEFELLTEKLNMHSLEMLMLELIREFDGKIIVVTDGSKQITCAYYPNKIEVFDIPLVDKLEIVDTTGAGDSFLAGFLGCYLRNGSASLCVKWGSWVARQVIGRLGCEIDGSDRAALFDIK